MPWKMALFWKVFLTVVGGFYILPLAALATVFDISLDKKCPLCASAPLCPSLYPWQAIRLLAVLVGLYAPWTAVHKSHVAPIYGNGKVVRFWGISGRIAVVTLRNVLLTAAHFIWWRPVASSLCIGLGAIFNAEIRSAWNSGLDCSRWQTGFVLLFVFKFLKVVVHAISYLVYRPQLPSATNAAYNEKDVTVIIPSIDNFGAAFTRCVSSVIQCNPAYIFIATVESKKNAAERACCRISKDLKVITVKEANKRAQFLEAVSFATTKIVVSADDQVYWGKNFLRYALAPFDDAHVGLVGTVKRVDREKFPLFSFQDILNYIAVMYLERSNFELTASYNVDGGVSTISGRTALMRADMVKDPKFAHAYLNKTWLYGMRGPLLVDDDKFVTRWCWSQGWKTVFYSHNEALMRTSITVTRWSQLSPKMHRWARTSWRSKPTEMFVERHVWKQQPWSVYATYFATTINIALFYDSLLWWTLSRSGWATGSIYACFGLLLLVCKLIKPLPHLLRCKRDILYIPIGILFGYYHGIIRLWALITAYDISWGSRDLKAASQQPAATEPKAVRHEASPAQSAGFGLDVTRREDLTDVSAIMPMIPSPQLSDVLANYQRGIPGHETPWATSCAVGLLEHHCDPPKPSPMGTHRRTRRYTIAV